MHVIVSAIITTCMREPFYVSRALKSVMSQTYPNIEIIIVDDSPADYSEKEKVHKTVLSICPEALFISHIEQRGAPAARNTGIEASSGDYIAFLDDDDEWLPEKIERQLSGFTDKEKTALVYCESYLYDDITEKRFLVKGQYYSGDVFRRLLKSNFIGSTSIPLIKKSYLDDIDGFDEEMKSAQDYDLYLRLSRISEFNFIEGSYVINHVHSNTRISTIYQNRILGYERLIMKYYDDLEREPKALAQQFRALLGLYRSEGKYSMAFRIWFSKLKMRPFDFVDNIKSLFIAIIGYENRLLKWLRRQMQMHEI